MERSLRVIRGREGGGGGGVVRDTVSPHVAHPGTEARQHPPASGVDICYGWWSVRLLHAPQPRSEEYPAPWGPKCLVNARGDRTPQRGYTGRRHATM